MKSNLFHAQLSEKKILHHNNYLIVSSEKLES